MKKVYRLNDLKEATLLEKPAKLAVLGLPVSHSASPLLHQAALDKLGIPVTYIRLEVELGEIAKAFALMRENGFIGCNVTVPHKLEAMAACDRISPLAKTLGAVNTIIFKPDEIVGHNTDGPGLIAAISETFKIDYTNATVAILGAGGGAGRAIATQIALNSPPELILINRSIDKIESLASALSIIAPHTKIHTLAIHDERVPSFCGCADLVIQTTSLGLNEGDQRVIPASSFNGKQYAYDTIYKPEKTRFLVDAETSGCKIGNGLSLLIHQGALAFQHWFPDTEPLAVMKRAFRKQQ